MAEQEVEQQSARRNLESSQIVRLFPAREPRVAASDDFFDAEAVHA